VHAVRPSSEHNTFESFLVMGKSFTELYREERTLVRSGDGALTGVHR
jgi:hypothetical protein